MPVTSTVDPPPTVAPLIQRGLGTPSNDWTRWFLAVWGLITSMPVIIGTRVMKTSVNAAIPTTVLPLPALVGGCYRLSWYIRITVTSGKNESVALTVRWTEGGIVRTVTGATVTETMGQANAMMMIVADPGSTISYSTTYSTVPPGSTDCYYRIAVVVEQL